MSEWIKWWEDEKLLSIILIGIVSVIAALLSSLFINNGWILSIVIACIGGICMRYFINKYSKSKFEKLENKQ